MRIDLAWALAQLVELAAGRAGSWRSWQLVELEAAGGSRGRARRSCAAVKMGPYGPDRRGPNGSQPSTMTQPNYGRWLPRGPSSTTTYYLRARPLAPLPAPELRAPELRAPELRAPELPSCELPSCEPPSCEVPGSQGLVGLAAGAELAARGAGSSWRWQGF